MAKSPFLPAGKRRISSVKIKQNLAQKQSELEECVVEIPERVPGEHTEAKLSPLVEEYIEDMCQSMMVPRDFVLAPALCALSAVCGSKVTIENRGYSNYTNLWAAVIAPSGTNKSQPAKRVFAPLRSIHQLFHKGYLKRLEEARQKAPAKTDPQAVTASVKREQIFLMDATPAARNEALADNPHGLLQYNDELASMLSNLDRFGATDEHAQLITIYDGGDLQINRKGDEARLIVRPFLSIFGTIQRQVFQQRMCKEKLLENGFTQRFLCFMPRKLPRMSYSASREPSAELQEHWSKLLVRIFNQPTQIQLRMSPWAETLYGGIVDAFTDEAYVLERYKSMYKATALAKMRVILLKLAALATMTRYGEEGFDGYIHCGEILWAQSVCLKLIDNFAELQDVALSGDAIISRHEAFMAAAAHFPQLADASVMTSFLNLPRGTAHRWLDEIREMMREEDEMEDFNAAAD